MVKVAYIFTGNVKFALVKATAISQLIEGIHNAEPKVMFFLEDTVHWLLKDTIGGDALGTIAEKYGTTMIACDTCVLIRDIKKENFIDGVLVACFPQFYEICHANEVDYIISL